MERILNLEKWLLEAKRDFLLHGKVEFKFPLRRRGSSETFYSDLEQELLDHPQLKVTSYRTVKEGYVSVARPSEICFGMSSLLDFDSEILSKRAQFLDLEARLGHFHSSEFVQKNYSLIEANLKELASALNIFEHIVENQENLRGLRPREIAHGESSKLIGKSTLLLALLKHRFEDASLTWETLFELLGLVDQKQEIRFFAPYCRFRASDLKDLHGVVHGSQFNQWTFAGLQGVLIIENYETFLSVAEKAARHLVIWGQGWKVISMVDFLKTLHGPIYYWGDIDSEGLDIFLRLQQSLPSVNSLGMNLQVLCKYEPQVQRLHGGGSMNAISAILNAFVDKRNSLNLSPEVELFHLLKEKGLRLEQEKISWQSEPEFQFTIERE